MEDDALKIGEVAEACEVSRDALRYWEQEGLIPEPPRFESSGYRAYPPETIRRVRAIQRAKELGFSLAEIRRLFEGRDRGESCEELGEIARRRIREFRREIERLERKIEGLRALQQACPGDRPVSECPVTDLLAEA